MERRPWVDVAVAFGNDENAEVICPVCRAATLKCLDLQLPSTTKKEFHIYCPECGAEQYLLK